MSAAPNRTFICSVVFLDIVGYSKKPVSEQIQLKERLNALLTEALASVAVNDRIILDTGDGAALSFLGDPEDALFACLTMRDAIAAPLPHGPGPGNLPLRIGINLGPVKLVKDINGQPNIIGDGINVAQRVMSFAEPGQVLVSRSYYEVVSCLSEDYVKLFHYEGARTDKHVREHEIYELEAVTPAVRQLVEKRRHARRRREVGSRRTHAFGVLSHRGLALGVLTGSTLAFVGAVVLMVQSQTDTVRPAAAPVRTPAPAPRIVAAAPPAPLSVPSIPLADVPSVQSAAPSPAPADAGRAGKAANVRSEPRREESPRPVVKEPEPVTAQPVFESRPEPAEKAPELAPVVTPPEPAARPAGPTALVALAISPWGEVYVNGKHMGVSPPMTELELPKGKYRIVVRNGSFKPFEEDYELGSNETVRIKHKFRQAR